MFRRLFTFLRGTRKPENAQAEKQHGATVEVQPQFVTTLHVVDPRYDDWKEGYPPDWEARRRVILERDNFICQSLGCCWRAGDIHHIVSRASGGDHRADNLVALCRVHHAIVHLATNKIEVRSYTSNRCTIVSRHWNRGALVPMHIRRFKRVTAAELIQIREHLGLRCRACNSPAWEGHLRVANNTIRIRCPDCNTRWKLEAGLREEAGTQLALIFKPTRNLGRFSFDPTLIQGLDLLKHWEGCPECDRNNRDGFLVKKFDEQKGEHYWGCTLHENVGCPYTRPLSSL